MIVLKLYGKYPPAFEYFKKRLTELSFLKDEMYKQKKATLKLKKL